MGAEPKDDFDPEKAEFFEALGHKTRIRILRALDSKPLGFSELKHAVGIESNGLLAFHLGRMAKLVRTDGEGAYTLTDEGREAVDLTGNLGWVQGIADGEEKRERVVQVRRKVLALLLVGLVVFATATGLLVAQGARIGPFQGTISVTVIVPEAGGNITLYSGSTFVGSVAGEGWNTFNVPFGVTLSGVIQADPGYSLKIHYGVGLVQGLYTSSSYFNITDPTSDQIEVWVFAHM